MSTTKRDDKNGWKKGAGVYSRSYPRSKDTKATDSTQPYVYLNNPPAAWRDYVVSDKQTSQSRIAGKSVWARADAASKVNYGLSGALPRGHRPAHRAGKLTGSGIDSPDTVKFRPGKDYR